MPRPCRATMLAAVCLMTNMLARLPLATAEAQQTPARAAALAFTGVTVVAVSDGRLLADQVVVVAGNLIQAVGRAGTVSIPPGAQVVDARGKYLIPGLWDMHVHVWDRPGLYGLFVANGVTGIRQMGGKYPLAKLLEARHEIAVGTRVGPRVITTGGKLFPVPREADAIVITTQEEARTAVDSLKRAGADFIKIYDGVAREPYFAAAAEARRLGLFFVGHLSSSIAATEASDSGQRSIEHLSELYGPRKSSQPSPCWPREEMGIDSVTIEKTCRELIAHFTRNETWLVPTLVTHKYALRRLFEPIRKLARRMARLGAGGRMLAGSDVTQNFSSIIPGAALHEELALLVETGLTPLAALQAATLNPARYFRATDSLGTIAPGKLADLVLLDADPLVSIYNVMRIRAVVANGRYFDRAALDSLYPQRAQYVKEYQATIDKYGRLPKGARLPLAIDEGPAPSGLPELSGARVKRLSKRSNAGAAGIEVGDVIIGVNHQRVESSWDLAMWQSLWEPGETVTMELVRNGTRQTMTITAE